MSAKTCELTIELYDLRRWVLRERRRLREMQRQIVEEKGPEHGPVAGAIYAHSQTLKQINRLKKTTA
jgi:hypothetical protein